MRKAVNGRKLIRAFAYVIKSEESTEEKFFEAIEEIGIEIRVKDLQIFHTGAKKADWDVGIAVDMIRLCEKVDVVVLASGDGDFIEVVRYCKSHGVRVEVMAFEKTTNNTIMEEVDHFIDLGDKNSKFLISARKRNSYSERRGYEEYDTNGYDVNSLEGGIPEPDFPAEIRSVSPIQQVPPSPGLTIDKAINPYQGSNLSTVNRIVKKPSSINPIIYGKNVRRKIKPVVGLPAKVIHPAFTRKNYVNDQTKPGQSLENAFGNPIPKKKKLF